MSRLHATALNRRQLLERLLLVPAAVPVLIGAEGGVEGGVAEADTLRGKLHAPTEDEVWLQLQDGIKVRLSGDEQTELVLHDERLKDLDVEVHGARVDVDRFEILPIHRPALFTWVDGERLRVTYYCDVCAIRTFSPGMCMCCREDTRIDLVDPSVVSR